MREGSQRETLAIIKRESDRPESSAAAFLPANVEEFRRCRLHLFPFIVVECKII
jgi:hypothetical protein